jgi:hypothetical protein
MAKGDSRRIYITLNPKKEKDRIISDWLSQSYSESDAIKEAIYRLATNSFQRVQMGTNCTEKVQIVPKRNKEVQKVTKRNSNKKVQKGAINTQKDEKGILPNSGNKDIKVTDSTEKVKADINDTSKVQQVDKSKIDEKKNKLLAGLSYFNKKTN